MQPLHVGYTARGGDDAALLPVDGRGDHEFRHLGGHGRGRRAFRRGDEPRVDQPDGAVVGGHVLLRRVRGHGDGGIGHDEQLLECRVGHCVGGRCVRGYSAAPKCRSGRRRGPSLG